NGRTSVRIAPNTSKENLGTPLLVRIPVSDEIEVVWNSIYEVGDKSLPFPKLVEFLADTCANRSFIKPVVGAQCKSCEFRIDDRLKSEGKKSGFEHCWQKAKSIQGADFNRPFVFD